jgi:hypothetical protein
MDGSFPLLRDPAQASPAPAVDKFKQEIAEARQGVRAKISTKAAAYYLDVHYTTLRDWVREGTGPEPVKNPAKPGTTALNQHLSFTLASLDAFIQARSGAVITRGKRTDADALRRETDRVLAAIDLKAAEDALAKARERAKRLGVVCFDTLADVAETQPWARIDGMLVGQLWTLDDATYARVDPDDVFEGSLEEALAQAWDSHAHRAPFDAAMSRVLSTVDPGRSLTLDPIAGLDLDELNALRQVLHEKAQELFSDRETLAGAEVAQLLKGTDRRTTVGALRPWLKAGVVIHGLRKQGLGWEIPVVELHRILDELVQLAHQARSLGIASQPAGAQPWGQGAPSGLAIVEQSREAWAAVFRALDALDADELQAQMEAKTGAAGGPSRPIPQLPPLDKKPGGRL